MIRIELVVVNGFLVGRRFQDRWNLETLGYPCGSLIASRNGNDLKKLRRAFGDCFTFVTIRNMTTVDMTMTDINLVIGIPPIVDIYGIEGISKAA